jgi:hypothetical protein
MNAKSPIVPILAGAGGALVAVVGADKLGVNPNVAAWGTAAAGAATALGTSGVVRDVATGVGAAGMCLGALQLFASAKAEAAKKEAAAHKASRRQADGDFITREQLNEALAQIADQQQKGHCDLVSALDDIRKIVANAEQQQGRGQPAPLPPPATRPTVEGVRRPSGVMPVLRREAAGDDYERNAYGDEERNAFGDEERNADFVDEYQRNAYGDDERNAFVEDYERNAGFDDERNAGFDDERNADADAP